MMWDLLTLEWLNKCDDDERETKSLRQFINLIWHFFQMVLFVAFKLIKNVKLFTLSLHQHWIAIYTDIGKWKPRKIVRVKKNKFFFMSNGNQLIIQQEVRFSIAVNGITCFVSFLKSSFLFFLSFPATEYLIELKLIFVWRIIFDLVWFSKLHIEISKSVNFRLIKARQSIKNFRFYHGLPTDC